MKIQCTYRYVAIKAPWWTPYTILANAWVFGTFRTKKERKKTKIRNRYNQVPHLPPFNAHADVFSRVRGLNISLSIHQHSYLMRASSKGTCKYTHEQWLTWVSVDWQCVNYPNLMCWLICLNPYSIYFAQVFIVCKFSVSVATESNNHLPFTKIYLNAKVSQPFNICVFFSIVQVRKFI